MTPTSACAQLEIVLITGMSGSGKSVVLRALEDAGYYCVDNLPPELLRDFVALERRHGASKVAIAIDVRSAVSLPQTPQYLQQLRGDSVAIKCIFLDANNETLVRRFSETRRAHPLSVAGSLDTTRALIDAIELERALLAQMREQAHVLDTSMLKSAQLQAYVKSLIAVPLNQLTLVFESFGFKRGVPSDADFVFDVRMLANPHYEPELRPLTGRHERIAQYLQADPAVKEMLSDIEKFLQRWMGSLARDHRSYVTVAIGCTGGQHRSVYLVEALAKCFAPDWKTLIRHRELDAALAP